MLKVFRRIRRQLLSENRFSKYLVYAAGEIFLVVVGILIALQINTANDKRKEQNVTQIYLAGLRGDAQNDVERLAFFINKSERYVQKSDSIFSLVKINKNSLDGVGIFRATYFIKNDTYQEIIANGHLKLLPNAIKTALRLSRPRRPSQFVKTSFSFCLCWQHQNISI